MGMDLFSHCRGTGAIFKHVIAFIVSHVSPIPNRTALSEQPLLPMVKFRRRINVKLWPLSRQLGRAVTKWWSPRIRRKTRQTASMVRLDDIDPQAWPPTASLLVAIPSSNSYSGPGGGIKFVTKAHDVTAPPSTPARAKRSQS